MASLRAGTLSSLRRQHLLAEFSGLKQACPAGVFVSLTPGDATLWSGVLFVRKGPYATAILRFQISFPDSYPRLPPLVTFSTDIFHPLITPLTTYTYTTDIQDNGTVSATDEERLPPGGFSLRHGFPDWFGRASRSAAAAAAASGSANSSRQASAQQQQGPEAAAAGSEGPRGTRTPPPRNTALSSVTTPDSKASPGQVAAPYAQTTRKEVSPYEVLRYIKSVFDDESVLDTVPLEAAGNPGAWHAWRTRQQALGRPVQDVPDSRGHGEWNWEGVWEDRVKKGIVASLSEPVLYGQAGAPDEVIRFLAMEEAETESVKGNLMRTLGSAA